MECLSERAMHVVASRLTCRTRSLFKKTGISGAAEAIQSMQTHDACEWDVEGMCMYELFDHIERVVVAHSCLCTGIWNAIDAFESFFTSADPLRVFHFRIVIAVEYSKVAKPDLVRELPTSSVKETWDMVTQQGLGNVLELFEVHLLPETIVG